MTRKLAITGFGYCNVEKECGAATVAFANGHAPAVRGEPMPADGRWGEYLPDLRLGYAEGQKLRARVDMDGDLPDYIVGLHFNRFSCERFAGQPRFKVRDLYERRRLPCSTLFSKCRRARIFARWPSG